MHSLLQYLRWLVRASTIALVAWLATGPVGLAQSRDDALAGSGPLPAGRRIVDPATGFIWVLLRSSSCTGCPGRLIPFASLGPRSAGAAEPPQLPAPVIRAGDLLLVDEASGPAKGSLTALASRPARAGELLNARLTVSGRQVRVIAQGPGRARLCPATEWQP